MTKAKLLIGVVNGSTSGAISYFKHETISVNSKVAASAAVGIVDAFILTGGGDIDPKRYDNHRSSTVWGINKERDELEFWIVEQCRKHNIPIMGICRGNQLLNVAMGGTLFQDIGKFEEDTHWGFTLPVNLNKKSGLARYIGEAFMPSSHYHHQAIDRLGDGLMPAAWSDDGFIEAIETWPGMQPFMLGTQFHPEMDWATSDENEDVFGYFLSMVEKRCKRSATERAKKFNAKFPAYSSVIRSGKTGTYQWSSDASKVEPKAIVPAATQTLEHDWDMLALKEDEEYTSEDDGFLSTVYRLDAVDEFCAFPPCRDPWACQPSTDDCLSAALAGDEACSRSLSRSENKRKGNGHDN